jgi:deoxycytidine triphosphate deaminase
MSILNYEDIKQRLEAKELIVDGTWDELKIGNASYEVRMNGTDLLVYHQESEIPQEWINGKELNGDDLIIPPNAVAVITTIERFIMPWDCVGMIGNKFDRIAKGLTLHPGLFIDPGFGQKEMPKGEPLILFLTNLGKEACHIGKGEAIARLQFTQIKEPTHKTERTAIETYNKFFKQVSAPANVGLGFFIEVASHKVRLEQLNEVQEGQKQRIEMVRQATTNLVFFGVFIMASAIFASSLSFLLQTKQKFLSSEPIWLVVGAVFVTALFFIGACAAIRWLQKQSAV